MDGSNWKWDSNGSPGGKPIPPRPQVIDSGPSGVVIVIVAALLVLGGYLLIQQLTEMTRIQDCVIQGRTNCAPIELIRHRAPRWPFRD